MTAVGKGRALVTGASSGIGESFARSLASDGYDLVICARRADRLEALAEQLREKHSSRVQVLPADLSAPGEAGRVADHALQAGPIDLLINNAGAGLFGAFADTDVDRATQIVRLNIEAVVELTGRIIKPMRDRKSGSIVLVASTAGFQPLPYIAVYSATKAFVLSFGEALSEEARHDGVHVMTLCPGLTATEFMGASAAISRGLSVPNAFIMTPQQVVRSAQRGLQGSSVLVVPGVLNWLGTVAARMSPGVLVRRVTGRVIRRLLSKTS